MKIKKLAALVSRAKQLYLYSHNGTQWAGTNSAFYLLPRNLPEMDSELLTLIMDIKPEKAAEFYIEAVAAPYTFPSGDSFPAESALLYDISCRVVYDDVDMLPAKSAGGGIYYIPTKQLGPVENAKQPGLYLRMWGNEPVIVVKDGMFITAIIKPIQHKTHFLPWLGEIYSGTSAVERIRREEE